MAADYCTTAQVAAHLGLLDDTLARADFDGTVTGAPSNAEVVAYIESAQDYIDEAINTAYRLKIVTDEYHTLRHRARIPSIQANNRYIQTLTKLEVYQGGDNWTDLVATGTEGAGVGDDDYFVDYNLGLIYINSTWPVYRPKNIRLTYTHRKSSTVDEAIRLATILLASAWLIEGAFDWVEALPQLGDAMTREAKAKSWTQRAEKLIELKTVPLSIPHG